MISFAGKVALVTGAGGGLGRAYALELARRGARVVVNDLGGAVDGSGAGSAAQSVVAEIRAQGFDAIANDASVTDRGAVAAMAAQAMDAYGRIDILINNAGILRDKSFQKMELDDAQAVIDVHLMGAFNCTKAVWPIMAAQEYGRIVMTTSPSGLYGNFGQANYGAAKMGLAGLMNTLRLEGERRNIRVNSISPVAATRMTAGLLPQEQLSGLGPEKVAAGVIYLCSEGAPNGVILQAAGGRFSVAAVMESPWVELGMDASADDVAAQWERISDLSGARTRA
ncbi:SDR family NAD(P)-dependent oxidoreductase [Massilia sp. LXY-6]|uniref:SDR family NAD(P)-dependent oxidoreductase n=1 Tax=Massilia sp. LXY-6 TaxID=3379823 RepID=UPI003EDFB140